jgi:Na+-transporting NADH:ubiquinone oxidoreductase subunit F
VNYADFDVEEEYRGDWERFGFFKLESKVADETGRSAPTPWPTTRKRRAS